MGFFLIGWLFLGFVLVGIGGFLLLFRYLVLLRSLALCLLLKFQILLYLDTRFLLLNRLLIFFFLLALLSIESFLLLVPSNLSPLHLTLMQGLINTHHLYLIRKLLASDPSSCSFLSLVGDEDAFVHFQLFLPLFRHINNIGIIIE